MVSIRRIEKYLNGAEVALVPPIEHQSQTIAFQSCTVTWPQDRLGSVAPSAASTPRHKFMLVDMTLNFPEGELSLICGKLGSGKTLMLLGMLSQVRFCVSLMLIISSALLGEADVLAGQLLSPRSPPDSLASFAGIRVSKEQWIVKGICAYVPQVNEQSSVDTKVQLIPLFSRLHGFATHQLKVSFEPRHAMQFTR